MSGSTSMGAMRSAGGMRAASTAVAAVPARSAGAGLIRPSTAQVGSCCSRYPLAQVAGFSSVGSSIMYAGAGPAEKQQASKPAAADQQRHCRPLKLNLAIFRWLLHICS